MSMGLKMSMANALWITGKQRAEMIKSELRMPTADEVTIESRFGAISRGTEALVVAGAVPEGEHDRMRAPLQEGDFPFPVKYGYAVVGTVTAGPPGRIGETVFCLHPHQDVFHAPAAMAVPVPATVPPSRAVLAANMETALNALWDAGVQAGDRVAVVGGGLLGLLVAYLAANVAGTRITVVDIEPERKVPATALGCGFAEPHEALSIAGGSDVVIHASASSKGLTTAISLAGFEARIVEMSWFGERVVEVPLGGAFHSQRLSIIASQVGHVPASRRARWPLARRMAVAMDLLADGRLDCLLSGETAFADLPQSYCGILADPGTLCHRIRY
jgi:threonine dehydrogenase-like Zn-dependent dehydrogenase